ncbi:YihY family inner membrane protein [Nitrospirillum sp. BR 11828]|uniref:YihY family inner membrane protein n=1 Tax=Nitrospirillum sp. BR 11828 TaxID=3104325 RepID=UPI002ACA91C5|nr:YihY family inner membrane protein [Nitrospirillum sp. BR 11828]MDZ5646168.1 YihY family inner membrane protein [Nitrospirillum sp. BR 11828]
MTETRARSPGWARWADHLPSAVRHVLLAVVGVTSYAVRRFYRDNCLQAVGSLTYTSLLAVVPLLTVGFAIFQAFPAFQTLRAEAEMLLLQNLVPQVGENLTDRLQQFVSNAGAMTGVGVLGLAVTSILLFFSIEGAYNAIWRSRERHSVLVRVLSFWAVLTMAPLLLGVSLSLSSIAVSYLGAEGSVVVELVRRVLPGILESAFFGLTYLAIPTRPVRWQDALVGGVVAGAAMEAAKVGFAVYIGQVHTYTTIYGALSVLPTVLLWLYLVWCLILFGAEVTAALPEWRSGRITELGPAGLSPAQRLVVALAILRELMLAAREGHALKRADVISRVPVGAVAVDGMLEQLCAANWTIRTADGAWVATRDPHESTLSDLYLALDFGMWGDLLSVGHLQAPWQAKVHAIFERARRDAGALMDTPLAKLLAPQGESETGEPIPEEPVSAEPPSMAARKRAGGPPPGR